MQTESSVSSGKKKQLNAAGKWLCVSLAALIVFGVGVGVGKGSIGLSVGGSNQNKNAPADLNYASVEQLYDSIRANYDGKLDTAKLLDGAKEGMAKATGDPYTVYFDAKSAKDFNNQLDGTFSGIGAELGQDPQGNLIVVAPIDGTPASKAGLRPQDVIVSIDGKTTTGMSIDAAVSKIRGTKGTKVVLRMVRDKSQDLSFTIVRDNIKVPSVKWEVLDGNVGYMQINQFSDDTGKLAEQAATEFKDKGVKGVVLDLRGNPGGLVDAAVDVSSLWLPRGATILQERQGGVVADTKLATGNDILSGVRTAVLINEGSASASEITAGALRDNKVATLFGAKSYGKGSVQQIVQLDGDSEAKITIARWYRPNGQNIDKKGITPDKAVKMTDDDYKNKRDPQKDAALDFIKS